MQLGVTDHIWTTGELVDAALEGVLPAPGGRRYGRFTVIDEGGMKLDASADNAFWEWGRREYLCHARFEARVYHFGTRPINIRWSMSGRSPDGQTVAMVLWGNTVWTIKRNRFHTAILAGINCSITTPRKALGNALRIFSGHGIICEGLFRVIIGVPVDPNDIDRGLAQAYPHNRLIMKLVALNERTGEFRAVNVGH